LRFLPCFLFEESGFRASPFPPPPKFIAFFSSASAARNWGSLILDPLVFFLLEMTLVLSRSGPPSFFFEGLEKWSLGLSDDIHSCSPFQPGPVFGSRKEVSPYGSAWGRGFAPGLISASPIAQLVVLHFFSTTREHPFSFLSCAPSGFLVRKAAPTFPFFLSRSVDSVPLL